jgi:hypothetical protein|tara:strand:+ start:1358 stop:1576 length:219 start_codon:yes stop_codon:yes gene_type:complete
MIYRCKNAILELRDKGRSSAFYLKGKLMFVGSSTVAMKFFVEHCEEDLDNKTLREFRNRLELQGSYKNRAVK